MAITKYRIEEIINNSDNVYDIYIELFLLLKNNEGDVETQYYKHLDSMVEYNKRIKKILHKKTFIVELPMENRKAIINVIKSFENVYLSAVSLFVVIDKIFGERDYKLSKSYDEDLFDRTVKLKPLNSNKTNRIGKVYYRESSLYR